MERKVLRLMKRRFRKLKTCLKSVLSRYRRRPRSSNKKVNWKKDKKRNRITVIQKERGWTLLLECLNIKRISQRIKMVKHHLIQQMMDQERNKKIHLPSCFNRWELLTQEVQIQVKILSKTLKWWICSKDYLVIWIRKMTRLKILKAYRRTKMLKWINYLNNLHHF